MNGEQHLLNNVERFSGYQGESNQYRPTAPELVVDLLISYLGKAPGRVVDLGCGTGLSSFVWTNHAREVIGVEPNDDMRTMAQQVRGSLEGADHISFVKGFSNQLDVDPASVDVVTCSQSFHWIDPVSTLPEVARVLQPNGVFAVYDCDWPPTVDWEEEGGCADS